MSPARLFYMIAIATALALCVVWQSTVQRRVGYQLAELQERIAEQQADRDVYRAHLSKLRNPRRIVALLDWLGMDLREQPQPAGPAVAGAAPGREIENLSVAALDD